MRVPRRHKLLEFLPNVAPLLESLYWEAQVYGQVAVHVSLKGHVVRILTHSQAFRFIFYEQP